MSVAQHSNKSAEWYTPSSWVARVRSVLGEIDLDPASSEEANKIVGAGEIFTAETDGLSRDWHGRVFLNPPGSCGKGPDGRLSVCGNEKVCSCRLPRRFWEKLLHSWEQGSVDSAVYLAYSLEQLQWLSLPIGTVVAIPKKRIKFVGGGKNPTHSNAFVGLGCDSEKFHAAFGDECLILATSQLGDSK